MTRTLARVDSSQLWSISNDPISSRCSLLDPIAHRTRSGPWFEIAHCTVSVQTTHSSHHADHNNAAPTTSCPPFHGRLTTTTPARWRSRVWSRTQPCIWKRGSKCPDLRPNLLPSSEVTYTSVIKSWVDACAVWGCGEKVFAANKRKRAVRRAGEEVEMCCDAHDWETFCVGHQGCGVGGKISDSISDFSKISDSLTWRGWHLPDKINGNRGAQQEISVSTKVSK